MPHIEWIGVIRGEPAAYQAGALDEGAQKLSLPATMSALMTRALPFALMPFVAIFASILGKTLSAGQVVISPATFVLGFVIGFAGLIAHEFLHAIAYPAGATVYIGLYPRACAAVALASWPLSRRRFLFMSLLPSALGIVPIALFLLSPASWRALNGLCAGLAIMGLISPYPDYYTAYQVLRQTPPGCRIQHFGDDTYFIV